MFPSHLPRQLQQFLVLVVLIPVPTPTIIPNQIREGRAQSTRMKAGAVAQWYSAGLYTKKQRQKQTRKGEAHL
jgi:hypothetical protein